MASTRAKVSEFRRARQPEQRAARRANILQTARLIAKSEGAIHVTISELGRRAQLTKASIYRYFESLEHVLLLILASELRDLADECGDGLSGAKLSLDVVASRIAAAYVRRLLLCELLGMVSSILEHNVSTDAIADAKLDVLRSSNRMAHAIAEAALGLSIGDAQWVSHSVALYVSGAWPAAHPSKAAAVVLTRPEFRGLRPDFEAELPRFVLALMRGVVRP
jgi:AcrR family transcriptional regulator